MVEEQIEVGWRWAGRRGGGWTIPPGRGSAVERFYPLSFRTRWRVRRLRGPVGPTTQVQFHALIDQGRFLNWWIGAAAEGIEDKLFLLRFPSGVWEVPWEFLIGELEDSQIRPRVSIVRGTETPIPESPSVFDEPLRVLLLKGASAGLDLDGEVDLILNAWRDLNYEARRCVEEPVVVSATAGPDDLPRLLRDHAPHVLWFSGHGRRDPRPGLLFEDGSWVEPRRYAELIQASGHALLYAVFWACDTGRASPSTAGSASSPAFFAELARTGIISALLVQAPIRDDSALVLAHAMFEALAVGHPLETSAARARARLFDSPVTKGNLDWVLPVVWSTGVLRAFTLEWAPADRARLQMLGAEILTHALPGPFQLDGSPIPAEQSRAATWRTRGKSWIVGAPDGEDLYVWLRTLRALQLAAPLTVICVDMDQDLESGLQNWAEDTYSRIRPREVPVEITRLLDAMKRDPQRTWPQLCSLTNLFLAVTSPPPPGSEWFWQPLAARAGNTVVLSPQDVTNEIVAEWEVDRIGQAQDGAAITAAIAEAPRLARALAVLGFPLADIYLRVPGIPEGEPAAVADWNLAEAALIKTAAGEWVMTTSAKEHVLSTLPDGEALRQAHEDCTRILGNKELRLTLELSGALLDHLIDAEMAEDAVGQATYLCEQYWKRRRPFAVRRTARRLGRWQTWLPQQARLTVAWANVALGRIDQARYWLARTNAAVFPAVAVQHALNAEVLKAEGTEEAYAGALDEIDRAIESCRAELRKGREKTRHEAQSLLRGYRQDRARILQYLFHQLEEAAQEYRSLIDETRDDPDADLDVAVMKRNYAECLRTIAIGARDSESGTVAWWVDDPRWQQARVLLREAAATADSYPLLPVRSEIRYEQAKMALAESADQDAVRLLGECIQAANEAGHFMMAAIAGNRLFWLAEPFSMPTWQKVADALASFPDHGWAVRSLMNSRIQAARALSRQQDQDPARSILEQNQQVIVQRRAFDVGESDKQRVVLTYAGLEVLQTGTKSPDRYWQELLNNHAWAREWLEGRGIPDAQAAWREL